jgi:acyl-CoA synthetase (NDP forming)
VKGVVLFTAGYRETGTPEGRNREEELVRVARAAGMRLIGPNCMGLYAPESGLAFFPELSREPGPLGLISQSGSLGNILGRIASQRGLRFSKAVSVGNQCDLNSEDFLEYLGQDAKTRLVGLYLEGVADGPRFLHVLRGACREKPVIVWKVGLTPEGRRAVFSHTGSLAGSREIWDAVARQAGAVAVEGFEPWVDGLVAFALLPERMGDRLAIISGPGGLAVSAAEACGREGMRLAELTPETRKVLREVVPSTGTSVANPIDVGLSASLDMKIYAESARVAASDPGVDAILMIGRGFSNEANREYARRVIETREETGKPFLVVNIPGPDVNFGQPFADAGVPFFETAERAVRACRLVVEYRRNREARSVSA